MSETVRAFIALTPPDEWRRMFAATRELVREVLTEKLPERALKSLRWVAPGNAHMTMLFLGDVQRDYITSIASELKNAAESTPEFELLPGKLGCFPSRGAPRVLWIGLRESPALMQLHTETASRLRPRRETLCPAADARSFDSSSFSPHLTLARLKNAGKEWRIVQDILPEIELVETGTWRVDKVELIQSNLSSRGSKYSVLAAMNLRDSY